MAGAATTQAFIGRQFGKLIVTEIGRGAGKDSSHYYCFCVCECGTEIVTKIEYLKKRKRETCGCQSTGYRKPFVKHGKSKTRLYHIWNGMISRCYFPKDSHHKYYGGKGIYVEKTWREDFLAFQAWAETNGYKDSLTLDRIDGNKSYTPDNCRWATVEVQNTNKINRLYLTAFGETKSLDDWSRDPRTKVGSSQIRHRVKRYKWGVERALTTPLMEQYSHKEPK